MMTLTSLLPLTTEGKSLQRERNCYYSVTFALRYYGKYPSGQMGKPDSSGILIADSNDLYTYLLFSGHCCTHYCVLTFDILCT